MTADLAAFLRARLDEREEQARRPRKMRQIYGEPCPNCGLPIVGYSMRPGELVPVRLQHEGSFPDCEFTSELFREFSDDGPTDAARFMLADIDAKRRIIDLHGETYGGGLVPFCSVCGWDETHIARDGGCFYVDEGHVHTPCPTLRLLALPWRDHPDYRAEEWTP